MSGCFDHDAFREWREGRGLTQADVADEIGVSQRAVGYWEQGRRAPTFDSLCGLQDRFGLSLDHLRKPGSPRAAVRSASPGECGCGGAAAKRVKYLGDWFWLCPSCAREAMGLEV